MQGEEAANVSETSLARLVPRDGNYPNRRFSFGYNFSRLKLS
jgi:hypothetical protein